MYIHKGRRNSINLGRPFPKELERPQPVYKNIIIEALKVQAFLEETTSRTQTDAGQHFNVTRARISQLTTIVNKLPAEFIEQMRECDDRRILKTFSGKRLLKIAGLENERNRRETIKLLSSALQK